MPIRTSALAMFIHCKMAPGTHATENQSAGSVVLRPRHRLENLSWEMNDHLHPVPHVENLSWKMNPASSEESYDGHVAVHQTCVPVCPVFVIKIAPVSTGVPAPHPASIKLPRWVLVGGGTSLEPTRQPCAQHVGSLPSQQILLY